MKIGMPLVMVNSTCSLSAPGCSRAGAGAAGVTSDRHAMLLCCTSLCSDVFVHNVCLDAWDAWWLLIKGAGEELSSGAGGRHRAGVCT